MAITASGLLRAGNGRLPSSGDERNQPKDQEQAETLVLSFRQNEKGNRRDEDDRAS